MIRSLLTFAAGGLVVGGLLLGQRLASSPPPSPLASPEARAAAAGTRTAMLPHLPRFLTGDVATRRAILDEHYYAPKLEEARRLYPVRESVLEIDGVHTEVFEPAGGIAADDTRRVLVNLHGGAFSVGARTGGRLESIPVASVAGLKVVSVDYRQGPEHRFPAASEDVATVYQHLLRGHAPGSIGIFGCSAGGLLTAQAVAWFDAHDLPRPGAVGIFCAGAGEFGVGDAAAIVATFGEPNASEEMVYLADVDWGDPLVAPLGHRGLLGRFPPTLVVTSTRDLALSSGLATHQGILGAGGHSELHVYEGLPHYFYADTGTPEARHVFDVTARFFDRWLER